MGLVGGAFVGAVVAGFVGIMIVVLVVWSIKVG